MEAVIAHVAFTVCKVEGWDERVVLLAPLAVMPEWQRQGIGRAMIRDGLGRLREEGVVCVFVLGDPGYYGRFGFAAETDVAPPYPLPDEWAGAWQSLSPAGRRCTLTGTLFVPPVWQRPSMWGP